MRGDLRSAEPGMLPRGSTKVLHYGLLIPEDSLKDLRRMELRGAGAYQGDGGVRRAMRISLLRPLDTRPVGRTHKGWSRSMKRGVAQQCQHTWARKGAG